MKRILIFLFVVATMIIGVSFALLNDQVVHFSYYFGGGDYPLSLVLIGALALGALLGVLACLGIMFRMWRKLSALRKEIKYKDNELMNLRIAPYKDQR